MKKELADDHPIRLSFSEALYEVLDRRLELTEADKLATYLGGMLVRFIAWDGVYGVRDAYGSPVTTVAEMLAEGDVRQKADSFDRERSVHQHIGDFLLFWSGLFPEFLASQSINLGKDALLNPIAQGRFSYHVVSTFAHEPYADDAPLFRNLSEHFEACQVGLKMVKGRFPGLA